MYGTMDIVSLENLGYTMQGMQYESIVYMSVRLTRISPSPHPVQTWVIS